jgi:hypothetical protein
MALMVEKLQKYIRRGENPQKSAVHPYPRLTRGLRYQDRLIEASDICNGGIGLIEDCGCISRHLRHMRPDERQNMHQK